MGAPPIPPIPPPLPLGDEGAHLPPLPPAPPPASSAPKALDLCVSAFVGGADGKLVVGAQAAMCSTLWTSNSPNPTKVGLQYGPRASATIDNKGLSSFKTMLRVSFVAEKGALGINLGVWGGFKYIRQDNFVNPADFTSKEIKDISISVIEVSGAVYVILKDKDGKNLLKAGIDVTVEFNNFISPNANVPSSVTLTPTLNVTLPFTLLEGKIKTAIPPPAPKELLSNENPLPDTKLPPKKPEVVTPPVPPPVPVDPALAKIEELEKNFDQRQGGINSVGEMVMGISYAELRYDGGKGAYAAADSFEVTEIDPTLKAKAEKDVKSWRFGGLPKIPGSNTIEVYLKSIDKALVFKDNGSLDETKDDALQRIRFGLASGFTEAMAIGLLNSLKNLKGYPSLNQDLLEKVIEKLGKFVSGLGSKPQQGSISPAGYTLSYLKSELDVLTKAKGTASSRAEELNAKIKQLEKEAATLRKIQNEFPKLGINATDALIFAYKEKPKGDGWKKFVKGATNEMSKNSIAIKNFLKVMQKQAADANINIVDLLKNNSRFRMRYLLFMALAYVYLESDNKVLFSKGKDVRAAFPVVKGGNPIGDNLLNLSKSLDSAQKDTHDILKLIDPTLSI